MSLPSESSPYDSFSIDDKPPGGPRQAAIAFILLTLFIDILGIGIVIPVLPELVRDLVGEDPTATVVASEMVSDAKSFSRAGRYVGVIGATYAAMQFCSRRSSVRCPIGSVDVRCCWSRCSGLASIF